jgi:hypothetical protein
LSKGQRSPDAAHLPAKAEVVIDCADAVLMKQADGGNL